MEILRLSKVDNPRFHLRLQWYCLGHINMPKYVSNESVSQIFLKFAPIYDIIKLNMYILSHTKKHEARQI